MFCEVGRMRRGAAGQDSPVDTQVREAATAAGVPTAAVEQGGVPGAGSP
jgi:hypothetical protein